MRWFNNLRLSAKLMSIAVIGICATGTVGFVSLVGIRKITAADTMMYEKIAVPLSQLADLSTKHQEIRVAISDALLAGNARDADAQVANVAKLRGAINGLEVDFEKTILTPALTDAFRQYAAARKAADPVQDRALELAQQGALRGNDAAGRAFVNSGAFREPATALTAAISLMDSLKTANAGVVAHANAATANIAMWLSILAAAIGALFGLGVAFVIARTMSAQMANVIQRMEQLSANCITSLKTGLQALQAGDLDAHAEHGTPKLDIDTKEEFGALASGLNSMIDSAAAAIQAFQKTTSTLRTVVAGTTSLITAAQDGKLDARAEVGELQGGYRTLVEGSNRMLDEMARPLNEASAVLTRLAARDLSARMTGSYQNDLLALKTALNTAVQNLSDALADVAGSAEQVAVASQQIASGSQLLAQGTSEQAAAVEEVSASLQEVSSMSQQNATNAQEAKGMAERGRTSVKSGIDSMDRLTAAIQKIKESSDATARIVKTIDEIAFQTNLLALNAAVEAARAGDAGKGFAVVADEVRSLAIRSAEAAKSTAALIEEGVQASGTGVALNAESLKALQDIDAQMDKIGEMLAEIATASNEQNQGVGQITTAIESVNQTTQSAAANAEESAATSEELSAQAAQMQGIVGSFQLADANRQPAAGAPTARPLTTRPAASTTGVRRSTSTPMTRRHPVPSSATHGQSHRPR